jgi:hypothetical protein
MRALRNAESHPFIGAAQHAAPSQKKLAAARWRVPSRLGGSKVCNSSLGFYRQRRVRYGGV